MQGIARRNFSLAWDTDETTSHVRREACDLIRRRFPRLLVDCISHCEVSRDAPRRVTIRPAHRLRGAVVAVDVPPDLAREVGGRGEDAAGEQVACDLAEPELDLVQPRAVGGGEVDLHRRMRLEERGHLLGLMRREVVAMM